MHVKHFGYERKYMSFRMESKNNFKNIELGDLKSLQADMNFGEKLDSTEIFGISISAFVRHLSNPYTI